jgi:hypothetical protein
MLEDLILLKAVDPREQAQYLRAAVLARSGRCMSPLHWHQLRLSLNNREEKRNVVLEAKNGLYSS